MLSRRPSSPAGGGFSANRLTPASWKSLNQSGAAPVTRGRDAVLVGRVAGLVDEVAHPRLGGVHALGVLVDREPEVARRSSTGTCRRPGSGTACSRCPPGRAPAVLATPCIWLMAHEPSAMTPILPVATSCLDGSQSVVVGSFSFRPALTTSYSSLSVMYWPLPASHGEASCASWPRSRGRRPRSPCTAATGTSASRPRSSCTAGRRPGPCP